MRSLEEKEGKLYFSGVRVCTENLLYPCSELNINEAQNLTPRQAALGRAPTAPLRHPRSGQFHRGMLGGYHCDDILNLPVLMGVATKRDLHHSARSSIVSPKGRFTFAISTQLSANDTEEWDRLMSYEATDNEEDEWPNGVPKLFYVRCNGGQTAL